MKRITYRDYFNKAYGCWLGKSIGGACGALPENNKSVLSYTLDNVFPDKIPPNDDLDLQVLWLVDVLEKHGVSLTPAILAESFAAHNTCIANEYAVAIKNIECGIMPPYSGLFLNGYFKDSMGCPIRSEIWAVCAPGSFETAKRYAAMDGCIDHDRESICSEQFNAVMESAAFFESDIRSLIGTAIAEVPEDCLVAASAALVCDCYDKGISWHDARARLVCRFGSQDASYSVVNSGLTLLALLYGEGDFTKTLLYAVNGGFDTDCTAATAMSVLGIITGAEGIPDFWLEKIGDDLVVGTVDIDCPYKTIRSFAEATCRSGISFMEAGLWDVELTDVPYGVVGSLPPSFPSPVDVQVDYDGAPVIGVGETRTVRVTVTNHTDEAICDVLSVTPAPCLECDGCAVDTTVMPHSSLSRSFTFSVKKGTPRLPVANVNLVSFGGVTAKAGLFGAYRMKLIGPFWDNYDTTVYDADPYRQRMQKKPDGESDIRAMFGCYVNVDREYINEDFSSQDCVDCDSAYVPYKYVNVHGDVFDADAEVTYRGSACVYLVYDLYVERDVEGTYHFGSNAPFKVWENGELINENRDYFTYTPFNDSPAAHLKRGKNRLVFKLTRLESFCFSFLLRDNADKEKYFRGMESCL